MQITDQLNNRLTIIHPPQRIVSLVPSQTELLFDLGLEDQLAGITKFCIHPEHLKRNATVVGGTKNPNLGLIRSLGPDLIVANKEENREEDIRKLAEWFPVYVSDVTDRSTAFGMINQLGAINHKSELAGKIVSEIEESFSQIQPLRDMKAAYLIWNDPVMLAGPDTFIGAMLDECGIENAYKGSEHYPKVSEAELKAMDPDLILLSSEPFPFSEKHLTRYADITPNARVMLVDGESFSWYGSHMIRSAKYLAEFTAGLQIRTNSHLK
jgi:ABC-type Fe3+-hydroxamate transport system substrate-binding protein